MSIGEANNPEDAHLFEEAVNGGYALLGYDDIDWSDDQYANREAIIEALEAEGHTDLNPQSGPVQMPHFFRNWVKKRDIVIVSKGNLLFRAIGEFTGKYKFRPRPEGGLCSSTRRTLALGGSRRSARQRDLHAKLHDEVDLPTPWERTQHTRT